MKGNGLSNPMVIALYSGALYFLCVAVAHALGFKIPGLYVYYSVPSYAYQDRIISFLAFGWSAFFFIAAKKLDVDMIKLIIIIGLLAIMALFVNTAVTEFKPFDPKIRRLPFLIIIFGLFTYWASLVIFARPYLKRKK